MTTLDSRKTISSAAQLGQQYSNKQQHNLRISIFNCIDISTFIDINLGCYLFGCTTQSQQQSFQTNVCYDPSVYKGTADICHLNTTLTYYFESTRYELDS